MRRLKIQGGLPGAEHSRPVLISTQVLTLKRKLAVSATYVGPIKGPKQDQSNGGIGVIS